MKKEASNLLRKGLWYFLVLALTASCGSDEKDAPPTPPEPEAPQITIDPAVTYQEMVGFGAR
jgi:hypothetical protein